MGAFWGFGRPQLVAPVTGKRGRLRGRDPARWKEGAILRFAIGRARPRPPQKIENSAGGRAGCRIFNLLRGVSSELRCPPRGAAAASQGAEGRFWILLDEALTRTSLLPASTPQLLVNWSIGLPLALRSALRTSKSVKNLCDYWNQQLPQGARGVSWNSKKKYSHEGH